MYLPCCKLHGVSLKHIEVGHSGGNYLLQLLECVWLKCKSCQALTGEGGEEAREKWKVKGEYCCELSTILYLPIRIELHVYTIYVLL